MNTKVTRKTITRLDTINNPSKQDEINFLNEVANACEGNTYLSSLFSEKFVSWVEQYIKNDFMPDISEMEILPLQNTITQNNNTITNLQNQLNDNEVAFEKYEKAIETLEHALELSRQKCDSKQEEIFEQRRLYSDLSHAAVEYQQEIGDKNRIIESQEKQLTELKARLFDLLDK